MAGKVTTITPLTSGRDTIAKIKISFTADDTDNSFDPAVISGFSGWVTNVYIDPGTPVPTTGLDIVLTMDGVDLLGGAGANIVTAANAIITPVNTVGDTSLPGFAGSITLTPTGNSEASAKFDAYVMIAL